MDGKQHTQVLAGKVGLLVREDMLNHLYLFGCAMNRSNLHLVMFVCNPKASTKISRIVAVNLKSCSVGEMNTTKSLAYKETLSDRP
jgi:hypothetical protein